MPGAERSTGTRGRVSVTTTCDFSLPSATLPSLQMTVSLPSPFYPLLASVLWPAFMREWLVV